jgi:CRISPR-associated protein Cmr3
VKHQEKSEEEQKKLLQKSTQNLFVAGPFWAEMKALQKVYVPIPRTRILAKEGYDEWFLKQDGTVWDRDRDSKKRDLEPDYFWFPITEWSKKTRSIYKNNSVGKQPWEYTPILHPKMEKNDRTVVSEDGLFLENAVQMQEGTCLIYLSSHSIQSGWYRLGGENHIVEIESHELKPDWAISKLLDEKIENKFALITPAIWGSNRLSLRHPPTSSSFPKVKQMLTDKPIPYRCSAGGRLGRGRYAVPAGTVYILEEGIGKSWSEWPSEWFPEEGYSLKQLGCSLSLPIEIQGESN